MLMKRIIQLLSFFICTCFIAISFVSAESNINKVWKIYSLSYDDSTWLYKNEASWSAVYIWEWKVLTNAHVVIDDEWIPYWIYELCITYDFKNEPVCFNIWDLEKYDITNDLALISIPNDYSKYPKTWTWVKFSSWKENIWDTATIIWYPWNWGENINLTQWKISWFSNGLYKTDADIDHWNSWWGAFNVNNELIWIPTAISQDTGVIGYIIPIKTVKEFLSSRTTLTYSKNNQAFKKYWIDHKKTLFNSTGTISLNGAYIKNVDTYDFSIMRFYHAKKLWLKNFILNSNIDWTYITISNSNVLQSNIDYGSSWAQNESTNDIKYVNKYIKIWWKKVFLGVTIIKKSNVVSLVFEHDWMFITIYWNLKEKKGLINALKLVIKNTHFTWSETYNNLSFNGYNYGVQDWIYATNYVFNNQLTNITTIDWYLIELEYYEYEEEFDFADFYYEDEVDYTKEDTEGLLKSEILENKLWDRFVLTKSYNKQYKFYTYYFTKYTQIDSKKGINYFEISVDKADKNTFESWLKTFLLNLKFDWSNFVQVKNTKNISNLDSFFR